MQEDSEAYILFLDVTCLDVTFICMITCLGEGIGASMGGKSKRSPPQEKKFIHMGGPFGLASL